MKMRRDREISGEPDLVLADIDARRTTDVTITTGSLFQQSSTGLTIYFSRSDGARVTVRSTEQQWVSHARTELERALFRNRPWYWWVRQWYVAHLSFTIAVFIGILFLANAQDATADATSFSFVSVFVGGLLAALLQYVVPAFELTEPGGKVRGSLVLGLLVTFGGWVGGIFLPQWLFG
ncbi:hypothetical protein D6T63_12195 [Arthrobacter cheniae]|uniref:Uncharacterized protein n=1 Tax=Arthrobacter cheniae TaxID=1258888 RepID=A0A3A5M0U3_9MICC|nr:hypothetical protein D6T63_12195 [Arthrobacter cheniae]